MKYHFFEKEILKWYAKNGRAHLPWRKKNTTPYEVWVSEIMLQQTQVSRVIEYYKNFLQRFPNIFDLAAVTWEEFYPYYAGLGYYNRGRNMLRCAEVVVEKYKAKFPEEKSKLLELPGIGEYTASAILSFGYNKNELAIDTNVKKIFGRVLHGNRLAAVDFETVKKNLKANKKNFNAAVMDLASNICIKIPRCAECPLQKICKYYTTEGRKEINVKKQKNNFRASEARVILWLHKNHKEYYSTNKKIFKPFILSNKYNTREKIKEYFRKNYKLELAVRPPHKKFLLLGEPVMFVNAQVLVGKNLFYPFSRSEIKSNIV